MARDKTATGGTLPAIGLNLGFGNSTIICCRFRRLENISLRDENTAELIACDCNTARAAIRKGFVDKAAGMPKLFGDLAYGATLRA